MKSEIINELWEEDMQLFSAMKGKYQSPNEQLFFETLLRLQEWDFSCSGDLLLSEKDNEDALFIMRVNFEEYVVGCTLITPRNNQHVMNLSEALAINLKACGFLNEDLTLLQWLQKHDYSAIRYDRNFDFK